MKSKLCLVVCESLKTEAEAVVKASGWEDVGVAAFHTSCMRPVADSQSLRAALDAAGSEASELHLVGGHCLGHPPPGDDYNCVVHKLQQCLEMFAGKSIVDAYVRQGAYLLTPGWLARWREHLGREGFSQETAREFFGETAARLVLLDTGVIPASGEVLRQFAEYVGRPCESVPIGTDLLQLYLSKLVLDWQLRNKMEQTDEALAGANRLNADYAAALDFVGNLTGAASEAEAVDKMLGLFTALFRPGRLAYRPAGPVAGQYAAAMRPSGPPPSGETPAGFSQDWSWTKSGKGFCLAIHHQGEPLGILEIDELQLPEFKQQYLNLSLTLRAVCGLAIAGARSHQRLVAALDEVKVANQELEAFSYSVSHDLRAPLRTMDGYAALVLEDYADKLDDRGKLYLEEVRKSSQLMGQLIDDILELSRLVRAEAHFEAVNISELAEQVAKELKRAEPWRQAEFVIASGLSAHGDRRLLKVVLENLMGNAFKFTCKRPDARIELGGAVKNGEPAYFVNDNGVGFAMEHAAKLFSPFQRLHSAADFPGTGVGLASVQRVVRRHGGKVWAEGRPNEGATFYFTLP